MWFDGVRTSAHTVNDKDQHTIGNLSAGILSSHKRCLCALLMLVLSASSGPILAQTDFPIKSESGDLKAQYLRELDKWMLQAYEGNQDAQFKLSLIHI